MPRTVKSPNKWLTGGIHDANSDYGYNADGSALPVGRDGLGDGTGGNRPDDNAPPPGGQGSSGTRSKSSAT